MRNSPHQKTLYHGVLTANNRNMSLVCVWFFTSLQTSIYYNSVYCETTFKIMTPIKHPTEPSALGIEPSALGIISFRPAPHHTDNRTTSKTLCLIFGRVEPEIKNN